MIIFMKRFFLLSVILSLGLLTGCQEHEPSNPNPEHSDRTASNRPVVSNEMSLVNGTTISASNDVAGMVVDKQTGKGIPGVAVTDGFTVVLTDGNGVYQFKRDPLCRRVYYTTPSSYRIALSDTHTPYFYSASDLKSGNSHCQGS